MSEGLASMGAQSHTWAMVPGMLSIVAKVPNKLQITIHVKIEKLYVIPPTMLAYNKG